METMTLPADIQLLCKIVPDFPIGIKEGFEDLFARFGYDGRTNYGISYMENGGIVYKVAITASVDELRNETYERFILQQGKYLAKEITGWMNNLHLIKETFQELMQHPAFDNTFPCVEWYQDDQKMLCMVKSSE